MYWTVSMGESPYCCIVREMSVSTTRSFLKLTDMDKKKRLSRIKDNAEKLISEISPKDYKEAILLSKAKSALLVLETTLSRLIQ